eukprot:gnl/MRDRNA2_/MRDRNA2_100341_c0_seq1.p1 gnl/MRDRNA2_/MRDRNA2_100341_c0~~gnl/MRDRNA2_/MRDRNA2_100341_c0_seq1.p1  ORF type:complete len:658 (+),score=117.99 gnl/MRDRNA2_/MRDRNA2_100341_c0_seq1:223-1974(+)
MSGSRSETAGEEGKPIVVVRNVLGEQKYPKVLKSMVLQPNSDGEIPSELGDFEFDARGYMRGLYMGDNPDKNLPDKKGEITNLAGSPGDTREPDKSKYDKELQDKVGAQRGVGTKFVFDNGLRGVVKLTKPMKYGTVQPNMMDAQKTIWSHGLTSLNKMLPGYDPDAGESWADDYVIATEAPLSSIKYREDMVHYFKTKQFKGIYVGSQAILAMYAYKATTGLVLDIGDGTTHVVPIFEGFALPHAIKRLDIGGEDLTKYLGRLLTEREDNYGRRFVSSAEQEILRKMKEEEVHVAPDDKAWQALNSQAYGSAGTVSLSGDLLCCPAQASAEVAEQCRDSGVEDTECADNEHNALNNEKHYTLPDGSSIEIADQKWRMYEPLFDPQLIGVESPGIQEIILATIKECDMDIRRRMYGDIFLSGGTCSAKGFDKRLQWDMEQLIEKDFVGSGAYNDDTMARRAARKPSVKVNALPSTTMGGVRDAVYSGAWTLPTLPDFASPGNGFGVFLDLKADNFKKHDIWKYADVLPNRHVLNREKDLQTGTPLGWDSDSQANIHKGYDGDRPGVNIPKQEEEEGTEGGTER